jgi:cyclase
MGDILSAGADKITINSSAVKNPDLIKEGAERFGSQCIVLAIDAKRVVIPANAGIQSRNVSVHSLDSPVKQGNDNKWTVYIKGGRENTGLDAVEWAKKAVELGAGEILLTSMDADGTKEGYDIELTKKIVESVNVPVIASGGAGKIEDVVDIFNGSNCSAALLASILHFKDVSIKEIKEIMVKEKIVTRVKV